jgi:hypothetical protein
MESDSIGTTTAELFAVPSESGMYDMSVRWVRNRSVRCGTSSVARCDDADAVMRTVRAARLHNVRKVLPAHPIYNLYL